MSEIYPLGEDVKVHDSELTMLHDHITERSMAAGWKAPQCYPFYSNLYDHAKHYLQRTEKAEAENARLRDYVITVAKFAVDLGYQSGHDKTVEGIYAPPRENDYAIFDGIDLMEVES